MKVGDYVRTKDGIIDQVIIEYNGYCASPSCNCKHVSCRRDYYDEDKIIKSSPNIIDLIEKKDIIKYRFNGYDYISEIFEYKNDLWVQNENNMFEISEINIKSIITKEQFSSMEYKIGE